MKDDCIGKCGSERPSATTCDCPSAASDFPVWPGIWWGIRPLTPLLTSTAIDTGRQGPSESLGLRAITRNKANSRRRQADPWGLRPSPAYSAKQSQFSVPRPIGRSAFPQGRACETKPICVGAEMGLSRLQEKSYVVLVRCIGPEKQSQFGREFEV